MTVDVDAGDFIAYWDAHPSDCGTTETLAGDREDYLPWYNLKTVAQTLKKHFDVRVPRISWLVDQTAEYSEYEPDLHRIDFGTVTFGRKWTAAHEYAHAIHHRALGGLWVAEQACYEERNVWEVSGYRCALQEGFADYAGNIAVGYHPHNWNWENPESNRGNNQDPNPEIEGYVAALFWDLTDSANDGNDRTNYSASQVATALRTCEVRIVANGAWLDRDDVSDFVWCLENRIEASVHERHFDDVPTPVAQRATRGSGWSASNIRSTWLQNITN